MANRFKSADPWSAFLLVYGWGNRVKRHTIMSPLRGSRLPSGNNLFSIEISPLRGLLCGLVTRQVALNLDGGESLRGSMLIDERQRIFLETVIHNCASEVDGSTFFLRIIFHLNAPIKTFSKNKLEPIFTLWIALVSYPMN